MAPTTKKPRKPRAPESFVPVSRRTETRVITDWNSLALTLDEKDIADIYRRSVYTIRKRRERGELPPPDFNKPNGWKRDRFRTFYENDRDGRGRKKARALPVLR